MKLSPSQLSLDHAGKYFRHMILKLSGDQTVAALRETPECWKAIQASREIRVLKSDQITVIDADGLRITERMPVTKAVGSEVFLGKPLRIIEMEAEALFADEIFEVVANGARYSIRDKRSGHTDQYTYETAKAAEHEIMRRRPRSAA